MKKSTHIRTGRHVVYSLHAHLVFVSKYRKIVFLKDILTEMYHIFTTVCNQFETTLIEFNGEADHVHLLVHYPPKLSLSKLVNSLKGVSSRLLRKKFPTQIQNFYWKGVLWSPSYFVSSCGGAPLKIIQQYIQSQQSPEH
jgi:putative transposase